MRTLDYKGHLSGSKGHFEGKRGRRISDGPAAQPKHQLCTPYSAASRTAPIRSTRAAQNLNSGILPNGSSAGLVNRLAAAST